MSVYVGSWVDYRCDDDCRFEGCPGHRMRSVLSDYGEAVAFEVEEEGGVVTRYHIEGAEWRAMVEAASVPFDQRRRYKSSEEAE